MQMCVSEYCILPDRNQRPVYICGWRCTVSLGSPLNRTTTEQFPSTLCSSRHLTSRIAHLVPIAHSFSIFCSSASSSPFYFFCVKNTVYAYPDMWVCLYSTYGCDALDLEEQCLDSATITEGGNASAVFSLGGEFEQEVPGVATLTESVSMLVFLTHACRARHQPLCSLTTDAGRP